MHIDKNALKNCANTFSEICLDELIAFEMNFDELMDKIRNGKWKNTRKCHIV